MSAIGGKFIRLQDPYKVAGSQERLEALSDKLSTAISRLMRSSEKGGNPFLFSVIAGREQNLCTEIHGQAIGTAATDGKTYFWNPDFIEKLPVHQVTTVMGHECLHDHLMHCHPARLGNRLGWCRKDYGISLDYIVNGILEDDHVKSGRNKAIPTLWGEALGEPIRFKTFLDWIDAKIQDLPKPGLFSDVSVLNRSPESLYEEIQAHRKTSPRRCKSEKGGCDALSLDPRTGKSVFGPGPYAPHCCQKCGAQPDSGNEGNGLGAMDGHLQTKASKEEMKSEMIKAAEFAKGRGTVPSAIESELLKLKNPELSADDFIRCCFHRRVRDLGEEKDWTRFNRRPEYIYKKENGVYRKIQRLYRPLKKGHQPRWLAMLDTSGSMSDEDIMNGTKELKAIYQKYPHAEGFVIPCDASPKWEAMVRVNDKTDIQRVKVVGRGGTVFDQFFADFKKHVPNPSEIDVILVLTDGFCGHVPMELRPPCDVVWLVVNSTEYKPTFGRCFNLKGALSQSW